MSNTTFASTTFEQLEAAYTSGGVDGALANLVDQLRSEKRYHELFEALKMQVRRRIGLPLLYGDASDNLQDFQRTQLEDGLIDACREVGMALLAEGRIREGWMYLRPVGDKKAAAAVLSQIEADEENMEELIDVCLREAVDTQRGFKMVLENYGTCNAITTFEGELARHSRSDQELAAGMLVFHLYQELMENLKTDIGRQEDATPSESTLKALVADRPWLFQELTYHVDTTHLASVTRFARQLQDKALVSLALDMTEYGRRLHKQFQYESEAPFEEFYPSHALYFQAVLGENEDAALAYFREQATKCDPHNQGTQPIEIYIDLLSRLGRYGEAIEASIQMMPEGSPSGGIAPTLIELSQKAGNFQRMTSHCRERGDLLGFAAALVKATK